MRARVSADLGRLTMQQRSTALALADAQLVHLPDEEEFGPDDANAWLAIFKEVRRNDAG
jgi:hypothetical protein